MNDEMAKDAESPHWIPGRLRDAANDVVTERGTGSRRPAWLVKFRSLVVLTDVLVIAGTLLAVQLVWLGTGGPRLPGLRAFSYTTAGTVIGLVWLIALAAVRSRSSRVIGFGTTEYQRVMNATLFAFGIVAILSYLLQVDLSRGYFLIALPVGLALLLLSRMWWRMALNRWRARGRCLNNALVLGRREDVSPLLDELRHNRAAGFRVVGVAVVEEAENGDRDDEVFDDEIVPTVLVEELMERARHPSVHSVILAGDLPGGREEIRRIGWNLEGSNAELVLVSRLTDVAGPRMHLRPVEGLPLVHVTLPQFSGLAYAVKRVVDVCISAFALLVLAPLFALISISIKLDDRGPIFFKQQRVGAHGKPFTMFKFRSMRVDAESLVAQLSDNDEGAGPLFKMKDDPRVTRVGKWLRRFSLDELPQFANSLIGTMSVVGPRPPLPREVADYAADVHRRLLTKPGITGPWQIGGRSDLSWEQSVRLDLGYVENWSITGDMVIILKTIRSVLRKQGAY